MYTRRAVAALLVTAALLAGGSVAIAQLPMSSRPRSGASVTPVFEGWYTNPDGTLMLSFGYFNRNTEETLEIPLGEDNRFGGGELDRGQPTVFLPGRQWGVFGFRVAPDMGDGKVYWTLNTRGVSHSVPGHLDRGYYLDALVGEAGTGNTPPVLRFAPDGPPSQGPGGDFGPSLAARVGAPVSLSIQANDDWRFEPYWHRGRDPERLALTWQKYRGPGSISFDSATVDIARGSDGVATTAATFDEPGEYVVRVLANDVSGTYPAGAAQCCWTNAYVRVTVSP
jgi:hypothetical protein